MHSITSDSILHDVAYRFLGTHSESAYKRLTEEGFTDEQKERIATFVNESDPTGIIVNKALQILEENIVCFTEIPDSVFANSYPCTIEWDGKSYSSAAACFPRSIKDTSHQPASPLWPTY